MLDFKFSEVSKGFYILFSDISTILDHLDFKFG